ncbi:PQQ-like beta-propeller repeat protein [candidate division KSB1 bacterium]|nr:PQQ-like beta-propeller repeat protein [candidate division KSB1 bacterium]
MIRLNKFKYFAYPMLVCISVQFGCSKFRLKSVSGSAEGIWPQLYKTAARSSCDTLTCSFPLKAQWQNRASSAIGPTIIALDHYVLFGTLDGSLEGYTLEKGESIGKINIRSKVPITCAYLEPYLIALRRTGKGNLICYDLHQAETRWSASVGIIFGEPLIHDSWIFLAAADGRILRVRTADGQISRRARSQARFLASPALLNDVLVVGDDQGVVSAFDASLEPLWQFETGASIRATPVLDEGRIYIGSTDGVFYCLDLLSGESLWQTPVEGRIFHTAAVCDEKIVFGATDHTVYCLDRRSGKIQWTFKSKSVIGTSPVLTKDTAFIGSLDKTFYALDLNTGAQKWKFTAKGRIRSNPIITHNYLLFAAENDYVYCFKLNAW